MNLGCHFINHEGHCYIRAHLGSHQHIIYKSWKFCCPTSNCGWKEVGLTGKSDEKKVPSLSTRVVVHIKTKCRNCSWLTCGRWIKEEMEEKAFKRMTGLKDQTVPPEWNPFYFLRVFVLKSCMWHPLTPTYVFFYWWLLASWFGSLLISHPTWNDFKLSSEAVHFLFLFLVDKCIGGIHMTVK